MDYRDELKRELYKTVRRLPEKRVAVAFSGGVDSSLLAKICKDVGKDVELFTVGFENDRDVKLAKGSADEMGMDSFHRIVSLDELKSTLMEVISKTTYRKIAGLNTSIGFYHVIDMAAQRGFNLVVSANGSDEIFCGYNRYVELYPDKKEIEKYMMETLRIAYHDKEQISIMALELGIAYEVPMLDEKIVDMSMKVPLSMKIKSKNDILRKHVLRQIAVEIGVPEHIAMRRKKAFQYSSGCMNAIKKLARRNGFTDSSGKSKGFESGLEAYIENIKAELGGSGEVFV